MHHLKLVLDGSVPCFLNFQCQKENWPQYVHVPFCKLQRALGIFIDLHVSLAKCTLFYSYYILVEVNIYTDVVVKI